MDKILRATQPIGYQFNYRIKGKRILKQRDINLAFRKFQSLGKLISFEPTREPITELPRETGRVLFLVEDNLPLQLDSKYSLGGSLTLEILDNTQRKPLTPKNPNQKWTYFSDGEFKDFLFNTVAFQSPKKQV